MLPIPNGYVPLIEAINAVGRDSYGEEWIGDQANQLARFAGPIRYKGPRSDSDRSIIADADKANEQRWAVFTAMQRDFLGTPPNFDDAVTVYLLPDDGQPPHVLPPKTWINDNEARQMLAMGRLGSGILLICEKSLPGRAPVTTSSVDQEPPVAPRSEAATDTPAAAFSVATPAPQGRRGSDNEILAAVKDYETAEATEGRQPNMDRAVKYVLTRFQRAGRTRVRGFYTKTVGQKGRGRPPKSRP